MNIDRLKILANSRLLVAVCALLGIEVSETDTLDWIIAAIQHSSAEMKGLLRILVVLAYAYFHPELPRINKADVPRTDGPAIIYPDEEV